MKKPWKHVSCAIRGRMLKVTDQWPEEPSWPVVKPSPCSGKFSDFYRKVDSKHRKNT